MKLSFNNFDEYRSSDIYLITLLYLHNNIHKIDSKAIVCYFYTNRIVKSKDIVSWKI